MLARANRVTRAADFRTTVRRGRRVSTAAAVIHVVDRQTSDASRFGFIVSKAVGGAVSRNLVKRRLRAVCREILPEIGDGKDVVIRALPGSDSAEWVSLSAEIATGLRQSMREK